MSRKSKRAVIAIFVLAASISLTYFWYYNPAYFPAVPEAFAIFLTDALHVHTAEDIATVGLLFGFAIFLVIVLFFTYIVCLIDRLVRSAR